VDALIVINYLNDPGSGSAESSATSNRSSLIAQGLAAQGLSIPSAVDATMAPLGEPASPVAAGHDAKKSPSAQPNAPEAVTASPIRSSSLDETEAELDELIELFASGR
jgi:hypothetical protein